MISLKYSELTSKIIECGMKVHAALGNGFQEVVYKRALEIEMYDAGLKFGREISIPVYYKNEQIGERKVDFLVDNKICVELKSLVQLEKVSCSQAKNFLDAFHLEIGLILNFGTCNLEFRRIENYKSLKRILDNI
jgi:GxxExxY protein